jgi:hypothetical protein
MNPYLKPTFLLAFILIFQNWGENLLGNERISFVKQIAPILLTRCQGCHGSKVAESDYRVDTFQQVLELGDRTPAIKANSLDKSEFYLRLISKDVDHRMPADADPLSKSEIELFRHWIEQGAGFDGKDPSSTLVELLAGLRHPTPPEFYPAAMSLSALAFNADQTRLVIGGYHELLVWDFAGRMDNRIQDVGERIYSVEFHPTRPTLLVASGTPGVRGEVRLIESQTGNLVAILSHSSEVILAAQFSLDGGRVAVGTSSGQIQIYDSKTHLKIMTLAGQSGQITSVAWDQTGSRLVAACQDHSCKVFDTQTGKVISTFSGHAKKVNDALFVNQSKDVLSCGEDGTAMVWNPDDGRKTRDLFRGQESVIGCLAVGNEYLIATPTRVRRFEANGNRQVGELVISNVSITSLAQGAQWLAIGGEKGQVRLVSAADWKTTVGFTAVPTKVVEIENNSLPEDRSSPNPVPFGPKK